MLRVPFKLPVLAYSTATACPAVPPTPVVTLSVSSKYDQTDPERATVDDDALEAYLEDMAPVKDYLATVSAMATRYVESDGRRLVEAACVLRYLETWARSSALTDLTTRQSVLSTTRILSGLAMAYRQVKGAPVGTNATRRTIDAWLGRIADEVKAAFTSDGSGPLSNRQNHRYWAGFAVAAVGVATGDRTDLDWAVNSYRIGACQIRMDGTLPLELARGERARDYHIHAVAPLVMTAELAEANGIPTYSLCSGAIHRLVSFVAGQIRDPGSIEAMTGQQQVEIPVRDGYLRGDRIAWLAPYASRFPSRSSAARALPLPERMTSTDLGGNLAALFPFP